MYKVSQVLYSLAWLLISCRCPTVRRNASQPYANGSNVLRPANLTNQLWFVDPEYFWFQSCSCREVSLMALLSTQMV